MPTGQLVSLAAAVAVLLAIAAGAGAAGGLGQGRAVLTATGRAVAQLIAVGAVIGAVFRTPALAPLYLAVMLAVASATSARRIRGVPLAGRAALLAIGSGALVSAAAVFGCRALPWDARTAVPFIAQLVGGSMTATTLAAQRMVDDVAAGWPEVEAWLALGAPGRRAVREPARRAAARALVPALDQTRNVGLVVLPGAFVGLLLGGATPLQAGRVQLLVLVGLLAAETTAAVLVTTVLAGRLGELKPAPLSGG